jgi:hypothetical protein
MSIMRGTSSAGLAGSNGTKLMARASQCRKLAFGFDFPFRLYHLMTRCLVYQNTFQFVQPRDGASILVQSALGPMLPSDFG